jgi:hypothetical protein
MAEDSERVVDLCRDAASLCRVASEMIARQSELESEVVALMLKACTRTALECELHLDAVFGECARHCRRVEEALVGAPSVTRPGPDSSER